MYTPYQWQESIGHRAEFVEARLAHGVPVIAVSIEAGILFYTYRRQARKLFEIYDQLAMAAIGQQSDIEAMRIAAIDFAHQEGYARSESDVTIHRVANAISGPMKRAFADFSAAPVVARAVFGEVGATPADDRFIMVEYDGDYHVRREYGFVAPHGEMAQLLDQRLEQAHLATATVETALDSLDKLWKDMRASEEVRDKSPLNDEYNREAALLERATTSSIRFKTVVDQSR